MPWPSLAGSALAAAGAVRAGQGIQRLGGAWYPLQAGDAVWMAPYVPQWYAALGRDASDASRYILYKDVKNDPLI
jgi:(S)-ureidoglycine aminohydrolase